MPKRESLRFQASKSSGEVSALLLLPNDPSCLLVLAHGAGADMHHRSMVGIADALAERRIATFRYQFPYSEKGSRAPSPQPVLIATVRSAIARAVDCADGLTLLAGGKSMGGRMTSLAASQQALPGVAGLVFIGFPLHPAGKPATQRGDHLAKVLQPMLFLQGTRDKLADLDLLRPVCKNLGRRATLHVVDGADHSFHMLKRSGRSDEEVLAELAHQVVAWASMLES
jgi:predicted alpha/beta-hydrolase family hydrolase